jgi:hypothetical protein
MILKGVVLSNPLAWGTVGTLHTFFTINTNDSEVAVKCDFLCYCRVNDDLSVEGEFRENPPRISSYKIEGKYFEAKAVENKTINLNFKQP